MSVSWACDTLAHKIEGSTLGNSLILVYPSYPYWFAPCTNTALIVDHYWFEAPLNSDASNDLRKYSGLHHRITPSPSYFFSPRLTKSWYLCLGHRPKGSELDSTSAGSRSPYINMNSDSIVIIPTYNERENIAQMIDTVLALPQPFHLLIVDDGSPDGTAAIVREKQAEYPGRVHLLERSGKLGLGTAYIAGFQWSLQHDYEYIFEMDCDFSHPPMKLLELYKACAEGGADVAVGSRYTRGGRVKNWPLDRILMSYGASLYVRLITFMPVKDSTAGFVCYRRRVLETMVLPEVHFKGYAFQIEMKYTAYCLGFKIKEVPITFEDRVLGTSKMNTSIFKEAFLGVFKLRYWHCFKGFPNKNTHSTNA